LGIDIQKLFNTIGTVTGYGANFFEDPKSIDGALVIQGTPDLRKIAEAGLVQATITTPERVSDVAGQPFPVYAVYPDNLPGDAQSREKGQLFVAFPPEGTVLVSKSPAQLVRAREVFLGHQPSLAKNPASPLASLLSNAHGAFVFSASVRPPMGRIPTMDNPANSAQSRIIQMANAGSFSMGETGPNTFAHAELIASSEVMADKLMKILQGMTAMVSLAETNDQSLNDFLNSASVARNDRTVTLHVAYSSARLSSMIQMVVNGPPQRATGPGGGRGAPRVDYGPVITEWKSLPEPAPVPDGTPKPAAAPAALAWQTAENVRLPGGAVITLTARTLSGRTLPGKNARIDRIEITPAGGGSPLVFRGEYMKLLGGFGFESAPAGLTTGKLLIARTPVSIAQFQFPGGEGTYTIKVAYLPFADGENTSYVINAKDPAAPAPEAQPNDDAAKRAPR
jgi:hypothetical protein